jgi:capsular polysaccharide biosynthesis protein
MAYRSLADSLVNTSENIEDGFDVLRFVEYLRKRWLTIFASCGIAVVLAVSASLMMSKKYTATASILIEPPAGNDPRAATAVSPVYLESLKTYEHFASSDSLFAQALEHLRLRKAYGRIPIESLKKTVLHVTKPRDTKILEISATLDSPKKAQEFAQYIAEQTVGLSRSLDRASEQDLTEQSGKLLTALSTRLKNAEQARDAFLASDPIEVLGSEIKSMTEIKARLESDLVESRTELAENQTRLKLLSSTAPGSHDEIWMREQVVAAQGRIASVEQQVNGILQTLAAKTALIEVRKHKREALEAEQKSARAQFEAANAKNNDILASAAFRGERLEIVDPGTVPERPSSPNVMLNVVIALFASLAGSTLYLGIRYSYLRLLQSRGIPSSGALRN